MANEGGLLSLSLSENQQFNAADKGNYTLLLALTSVLMLRWQIKARSGASSNFQLGQEVPDGFPGHPRGQGNEERWLFLS